MDPNQKTMMVEGFVAAFNHLPRILVPWTAPPARLAGRLANERNYRTLEAVEQIAKERGRPISQVALAWVNQQHGVSSVIYGARTEEQNEQNLGAIGFKLEAAELEALNAASAPAPEYPTAMQARLPGYPGR